MKIKFEAMGRTFEANSTLTYNWVYPTGRKGERNRINKKGFLQLMKEQIVIYNNKHVEFLAKSNGIKF